MTHSYVCHEKIGLCAMKNWFVRHVEQAVALKTLIIDWVHELDHTERESKRETEREREKEREREREDEF